KVSELHVAGSCSVSRVIIGCMLLGLTSSQCWAYSGGLGTLQAPYVLSSPEDLIQLSTSPRDYDKHFVFTADIDLAGYAFDQAVIAPRTEDFVDPFSDEGSFTGTIDGNGHVVSNLTITGGNHLGLIGVFKSPGQILGLGIVDANVTGTGQSIGVLAGRSSGHIRQCFSMGSVTGESEVGGLVGRNESKIENCFTGGSVSGLDSVGGLMGRSRQMGELSNSYSTCLIQREPRENEGGLSGGGSKRDIFSSFWDIETSGISSGEGGTGLSTVLMQNEQTYLQAGWDFVGEPENGLTDIWIIPESGGYPELSIFYGTRPSLPFDSGVALGRCTLSADPNEVMWNGAEVFDAAWDRVSSTEIIANPVTRPALDPNNKTRTITISGRVDTLESANLLGLDTRQAVVCQVLGEQGGILTLQGHLSPFEPSFCWTMLPETPQSFELQFQLDPHRPMPSVLSQVDFYVHALEYDLLTTVTVPFESMDEWQTLIPGYDIKIENIIVEGEKWEYTVLEKLQDRRPPQVLIMPGATECEITNFPLGPPGHRLWDVDVLYDKRTIYGENHTVSGGRVSGRGETVDGVSVYATTTSTTGHLDITRFEYTFALSTRKRVVPLKLTDVPLP
ncbi:MAG: hypothetical protein HQ515_26085, partial [Phycisphaeraceae bacterium]|nr:hypothetical protein [Phycisphaeraceae bacterium]